MDKRISAIGTVAAVFFCDLQTAAQITIPIETKQNALVLQADTNKNLGIIYFGSKLKNAGEYSQIPSLYNQTDDYTGQANAAYSTAGSRNLFEPAIALTHADGNNSLDLQYVSHDHKKIDVNNRYGAGSLLPIRLQGLDAARKYVMKEVNLYPGSKSSIDSTKQYTGEFLMTIGFNPDVKAGRNSVVLEIKAI